MRKHTYVSAEKFILSREFFGMKLGLDNITRFLEEIGNPQQKYPTIHISGTNGKGSTAAMLDSVLRAQGYKTGLFTSPHLTTLRERAKINGELIPKRSVISFVDRYRTVLARRKLSFFEVITAMTFDHFSKAGVEVAVIETGLGGRLDATNVLEPILTITTEISRDHLEVLGTTIKKIAFEKAGIIKSGVPHLIGLLPKEAEKVFRDKCDQVGSPLLKLQKKEFEPARKDMALSFKSNGTALKNVRPGLYGTHQLLNSALAMKASSILRQNGFKINLSSIKKGLAGVDWPGRFQILNESGKPTLILDVGHNDNGVATFVKSFQRKFPGQKAKIITGLVKRKEHQKIFNSLAKISEVYHLVPLSTRRTVDIDELIKTLDFKKVPVLKSKSLKKAFDGLYQQGHDDDIVIIIGSHYLVGEFLEKIWKK